jgi:hypothetical protein
MNDTHASLETVADTPLQTAVLTAFFSSSVTALYVLAEVEPAPVVQLFILWSPTLAVILWLQKDAARTKVGNVLDLGYFLCLALPVVLPWYAVKTRGRAGWRLLVGLLGLMFAPHVTGVVVAWAAYAVST